MLEQGWRHVAVRFATFLAGLTPPATTRLAIDTARHQIDALLRRPTLASGAAVDGRRREPRPPVPRLCVPPTQIVGGYANDTAIADGRPLDLLVLLDEEARPRLAQPHPGGAFPAAVHRLIALFCQHYRPVELDPQGWIVLQTAGGGGANPLRIRLLPVFACAGGGVLVATPPRPRATLSWRHLNAAAHAERLHVLDQLSDGKARDLVRLIKAWRNAADVALSGFAIELLVCDFLDVWIYRRRSLLFYDWMVRDFFFWLTTQAGRALSVPGTLEVLQVDGSWRAATAAAYAAAQTAADLERDNAAAALVHWRQIFGSGFGRSAAGRRRATGTPMLPPTPEAAFIVTTLSRLPAAPTPESPTPADGSRLRPTA